MTLHTLARTQCVCVCQTWLNMSFIKRILHYGLQQESEVSFQQHMTDLRTSQCECLHECTGNLRHKGRTHTEGVWEEQR